jgi:hypothetical protein
MGKLPRRPRFQQALRDLTDGRASCRDVASGSASLPARERLRNRAHEVRHLAHARPGHYTRRAMPTAADIRPRVVAALSDRPCRPFAISGRTGVGKTTLLRAVTAEGDLEPVWYSAVDLVERVVEALRCDRYAALRAALATDPRPLVVEHLEDLRGKPSTREELRRLLVLRAASGGATVLTLTAGRDDAEIVRWLDGWADVVSLD